MPEKKHSEDKIPALRTLAAEALGRELLDEQKISATIPEEIKGLLHELRVHQIELEIQNEELRRTQQALEESRNRFIDLYDCAPVAYLTLNDKGIILEANLTATRLLDTERRALIRKPFSLFLCREELCKYDLYLDTLFDSKVSNTCETRLQKKDGASTYIQLNGVAIRDSHGCLSQYRLTITDISDRKKMEEALQRANDELGLRVRERTAELERAREATASERQRLYYILETMPIMVCLLTPDYHVSFANRSFREKFGEDNGRHCYDYCFGLKEPCNFCESYRVLQTGKPHHWEVLGPEGSIIDVYDFPFTDIDGSPLILKIDVDVTENRRAEQRLVAALEEIRKLNDDLEMRIGKRTSQLMSVNENLISEIIERKKAEEALHESEALFRALFEQAAVGVAQINSHDGQFVRTNQRYCDIVGYTREEMEQLTFQKITHPDDLEVDLANMQLLLSGKILEFSMEKRYFHKNGSIIWVNLSVSPMWDVGEDPDFHIVVVEDITDRKQAQDNLIESERRYRSLFENIPVGFVLFEVLQDDKGVPTDLIVLSANKGFEITTGFKIRHIIGKRFTQLLPGIENDSTDWIGIYGTVALTGEPMHFEQDSEILGSCYSITAYQAGPQQCAVTFVDSTERKLAEEALAAERSKFKSILDHMIDGVYIVNSQYGIEYVNPALLSERGDVAGRKCHEYLVGRAEPCPWCRHREVLAGESILWEHTSDMTGRTCEIFGTPIKNQDSSTSILVILHDITERKRLERQFRQAQKMEAVGTLAGGVAHDFNNLLQVILGYSELVLTDDDLPDEFRSDLERIHQAGRSGADLAQRLLTFSRKTEPKFLLMDLNQRIRQLQKFLERTIPKMIDIEMALANDLAHIHADPTQMDQVLMNLAVNARDAMPNGGKILIETKNVFLEEVCDEAPFGAKPGQYVLMIMSDMGFGIDKETLDHIFDPFYTTKGAGKGTGLGLAVVYGIVQQHCGYITCSSEPGEGATFKCYFPAAELEMDQDVAKTGIMPAFGTETILLVDDEEFVRDLGKRTLERSGYTVLTAANGKAALDLYSRDRQGISLVILDLMMPEMGGKDCLESLLMIDPEVKVLVASGLAVKGYTGETLVRGARGSVGKPFDIKKLLGAVREALDSD